MRIVFDFDHTLFSTQRFYDALKKGFKNLGVEENLFQESFQESKKETGHYVSSKQFDLIVKEKPKIKKKDLRGLFKKVLKNSFKFLYKDTLFFLKKWQKKADLYILSYSRDRFQKEKINSSGIEIFFKKVIVTKDIEKIKPFGKVFKNSEEIMFVDDNPQVLFKIKENFKNIISVRINRGEGKYSKLPDNKNIDFSIKNLKKLEKILKKYV